MNVVLISTYELGHQPFGLASPATWLMEETETHVSCIDLAVDRVEGVHLERVAQANLIAFYVPMHTATRMASRALAKIRRINPTAHLCFFGLYAPVNETYLRRIGGQTILGGEFEPGLVSLVNRLAANVDPAVHQTQVEPVIALDRLKFKVPDRSVLPGLDRYAWLEMAGGGRRVSGYTEATRGCKHLCRHCPIVPVYGGRFSVVSPDIVMEDVRNQVAAGAQHMTFGDPDFFNGPGHAMRIVKALHEEFPSLTYDVTIKIEHLLKERGRLTELKQTGCLFVTSAVEAIHPDILEILAKHHTREDFIESVSLLRQAGLEFNPTFVTFTPWHTPRKYLELLELLLELDLVDSVAPIQYAIRLLIPEGSKLLELETTRAVIHQFDETALSYRWESHDPQMEPLFESIRGTVARGLERDAGRRAIFREVWAQASETCGQPSVPELDQTRPVRIPPHMSEPWFCCAEPTEEQIEAL